MTETRSWDDIVESQGWSQETQTELLLRFIEQSDFANDLDAWATNLADEENGRSCNDIHSRRVRP